MDGTGLIYMRARYYDPEVGRFITADPMPGRPDLPQTLNPYAYAHNNPVNLTDPAGLSPLYPRGTPSTRDMIVTMAVLAAPVLGYAAIEGIAYMAALATASAQVAQRVVPRLAAPAQGAQAATKKCSDFKVVVGEGGVGVKVPSNYVGRVADNGKGLVYQDPVARQNFLNNAGPKDANSIRIMDPVTSGRYQYPKGYVRYYDSLGRALDAAGKPSQPRSASHIPLDYTGVLPAWPK